MSIGHIPVINDHWSQSELLERLRGFEGGQLQIEARHGEIWRGKIKSSYVPKGMLGNHVIIVEFEWLCVRRMVNDKHGTPIPVWFELKLTTPGSHFFTLSYGKYYPQEDEERIKLLTDLGEPCHFYPTSDHTNLVFQEKTEEFVPYYTTCKLALRIIAIGFLVSRQNNPRIK